MKGFVFLISPFNADSKFVIANYLRKTQSHLYLSLLLLLLLSYIINVIIIYLNDSFFILIFHLKNTLPFKMTEMTIFVTRVFGPETYFPYLIAKMSKWIQVAETSCQMLEVFLSFSDGKRALSPSTEISVLTFVLKKSTMELSRVSIFWVHRRGNFHGKCRSSSLVVSEHLIKLVEDWRRLPHFPAKMTLVWARALLIVGKISFS